MPALARVSAIRIGIGCTNNQVIEAIAVDITRRAYRTTGEVTLINAVEYEAVATIEQAQIKLCWKSHFAIILFVYNYSGLLTQTVFLFSVWYLLSPPLSIVDYPSATLNTRLISSLRIPIAWGRFTCDSTTTS